MPKIDFIFLNGERRSIQVPKGSNLRQVLLQHQLSPYTSITTNLNCGGRGICATCGLWLQPAPKPKHWHDQLAQRFGYPRLSCQITVEQDLEVRQVNKWIWGHRQFERS